MYAFVGEVLSGERSLLLFTGMFWPVVALLLLGAAVEVLVANIAPDVSVLFYAPYLLSAMAAFLYAMFARWLGEHVRMAYTWLFRLLIISALLSCAALTLGANIVESLETSYWFNSDEGLDIKEKHVTLALLNLPFDALTILISYALLKLSISRGTSLALVAAVDIATSLVLSIALLFLIGHAGPESTPLTVAEAIDAITAISSGQPAVSVDALALLPLLLTTVVPVAAYMSFFLATGLILKPLAKLAAYVCGLLGEKGNSPFLELAVLISMIAAGARVIAEWEGIPGLF